MYFVLRPGNIYPEIINSNKYLPADDKALYNIFSSLLSTRYLSNIVSLLQSFVTRFLVPDARRCSR
jgi:hypothetical protein